MLEFVIAVVRVAKFWLCRLAKLQCTHERIILIYTIYPARHRNDKNELYTYQHLSSLKKNLYYFCSLSVYTMLSVLYFYI